MGRCYEFGAVVHEGCGHAMVVTDAGGACGCAVCGALCEGRFKGCAQVVAQPGYVPVSAPAWARPGAEVDPAVPPAATPPSRRRNGSSVPSEVAPPTWRVSTTEPLGVELLPSQPASIRRADRPGERPDRAAGAIEVLQRQLQERDVELAEAFGRLSDAYTALTEELAFEREARVRLVNAVHDLSTRIDQASRPIFGLKARRSA